MADLAEVEQVRRLLAAVRRLDRTGPAAVYYRYREQSTLRAVGHTATRV